MTDPRPAGVWEGERQAFLRALRDMLDDATIPDDVKQHEVTATVQAMRQLAGLRGLPFPA